MASIGLLSPPLPPHDTHNSSLNVVILTNPTIIEFTVKVTETQRVQHFCILR